MATRKPGKKSTAAKPTKLVGTQAGGRKIYQREQAKRGAVTVIKKPNGSVASSATNPGQSTADRARKAAAAQQRNNAAVTARANKQAESYGYTKGLVKRSAAAKRKGK